jgi:hypothetical protein
VSLLALLTPCVLPPPEVVKDYASAFDKQVERLTNKVFGAYQLDELGRIQNQLSISEGGLGLKSAVTTSIPAFLGSMNDNLTILPTIFPTLATKLRESLTVSTHPLFSHINNSLENINSTFASLSKSSTHSQAASSLTKPPSTLSDLAAADGKLQKRLTAIANLRIEHDYYNHKDFSSNHHNNIVSLKQVGAGAALMATPLCATQINFDNPTFQVYLARRTLLPLDLVQGENVQCICSGGYVYNRTGVEDTKLQKLKDATHQETCLKFGGPIHRHNSVRDELIDYCDDHDVKATPELPLSSVTHPNTQERLDILVNSIKGGEANFSMAYDVTIANIGSEKSKDKPVALRAASAAAKEKHHKYDNLCKAKQWHLAALAFENTGAQSDETHAALREIACHAEGPKATAFGLSQRLAVALQASNARAILRLAKQVNSNNNSNSNSNRFAPPRRAGGLPADAHQPSAGRLVQRPPSAAPLSTEAGPAGTPSD